MAKGTQNNVFIGDAEGLPQLGPLYGTAASLSTPQVQTFAGSDVTVIFFVPMLKPSEKSNVARSYLETKDLQTITVSSTTSVLPVRRIGEQRPISFTQGARTFAGSMIFTVINKDPFQEIFQLDPINSSATNDGAWHIDSMPAFDAIITAQNETGGMAVQIIHGIKITNWGTSYSIDDMYIESSYTYIAEHVTPFVLNSNAAAGLYGVLNNVLKNRRSWDGVGRTQGEQRAAEYLRSISTLAADTEDNVRWQSVKKPPPHPLSFTLTDPDTGAPLEGLDLDFMDFYAGGEFAGEPGQEKLQALLENLMGGGRSAVIAINDVNAAPGFYSPWQ
jgi:hypothetical protein